jgi:uncharacterized flavoprotein (TIGR03862 family)
MGTVRADVLVCGAGPAGLAAAERAALAGATVTVVDTKRSPGRKFLLAGRSGLNLTHSEPIESMVGRFSGSAAPFVRTAIGAYPPDALRAWSEGLGETTYVGTSGRVFPRSMRATPLLRSWLARLTSLGVSFHSEFRWQGTRTLSGVGQRAGEVLYVEAAATVLAFGGGSWPRTGSDAKWTSTLHSAGVEIAELQPSNVGVLVDWSSVLIDRYEGEPLKNVLVTSGDAIARGDAVITKSGLQGGPIYTVSANVRSGSPLVINLRPDLTHDQLRVLIAAARTGDSLSNRLRKVGISKSGVALLLECGAKAVAHDVEALAHLIGHAVVPARGVASIERAISTSGGIRGSMIDDAGMLTSLPGVFVAGEMLDWDAPTGGYLLQGCWSTGCRVGDAVAGYVGR